MNIPEHVLFLLAVGAAGLYEVLHHPVLKGVVGDHYQPSARSEGVGRAFEEFLQRSHLVVHLNPESLIDLRKVLVLSEFRKGGLDGLIELAGGADRISVPC